MNEDEFIPISAIQHILFCERQFALIHLEQIWEENLFTAEGEVLHERVHRETSENRKMFREEYGMAVQCKKYGITGKCDLVEIWFGENKIVQKANPVEFKRGKQKETNVDKVQLCAQALCLEEMFGIKIERGQLYYFKDHRRTTIDFTESLRKETIALAEKCRNILKDTATPAAIYGKKKCDNCSLIELCMPKLSWAKSVQKYMQAQLRYVQKEGIAEQSAEDEKEI
jgi:CRISPR-associated exonuclease Cas4